MSTDGAAAAANEGKKLIAELMTVGGGQRVKRNKK
jgi:hypothetical protein